MAAGVVALFAVLAGLTWAYIASRPTALDLFWRPVIQQTHSVMLCLGRSNFRAADPPPGSWHPVDPHQVAVAWWDAETLARVGRAGAIEGCIALLLPGRPGDLQRFSAEARGFDRRLQRSVDVGVDVAHAVYLPTERKGSMDRGSRPARVPGLEERPDANRRARKPGTSSRTMPSSRESPTREQDLSQLRWPDFGVMELWRLDGSSPIRSICRTSASELASSPIKAICKL